jgi:hypothetical protein
VLDHNSSMGLGFTIVGFLSLGIFFLFAIVRPKQLEVMK